MSDRSQPQQTDPIPDDAYERVIRITKGLSDALHQFVEEISSTYQATKSLSEVLLADEDD